MASQPLAKKKKPPHTEGSQSIKEAVEALHGSKLEQVERRKSALQGPDLAHSRNERQVTRKPEARPAPRCEKCGTRIWAGFRECGNERERRWTASISPTLLMDDAKRVRTPTTPVTSETEDAGPEVEYAPSEPYQECIESSEPEVITVSSPTTST